MFVIGMKKQTNKETVLTKNKMRRLVIFENKKMFRSSIEL